jgi:hypothetical protein
MEIYLDPQFESIRDTAEWWVSVGRGIASYELGRSREFVSVADMAAQVTEFGELIAGMNLEPHDPDGLDKVRAAWTNFINPVELGVLEARLLAVYKIATNGLHSFNCAKFEAHRCDCWRDQVLTAIGNDDPWLR